MQVQPYVTQVQGQLSAAAALGDDATRATANVLAVAAEPAVRLAVLGAVSAAADEITAALLDSPGAPAVSVRIDQDDLRIEVHVSDAAEPVAETPAAGPDEADPTARISLRLSEALKGQIEVAARVDAVSVNSWILRAASLALAGTGARGRGRSAGSGGGRRVTGWFNG
jgi:hypothetical protein